MTDTAIDPFFHAAAKELDGALTTALGVWAQHPELIEPTAAALDADGQTEAAAQLRGFAQIPQKQRDALAATVRDLTAAGWE